MPFNVTVLKTDEILPTLAFSSNLTAAIRTAKKKNALAPLSKTNTHQHSPHE